VNRRKPNMPASGTNEQESERRRGTLGWEDPLVREGRLPWTEYRGVQPFGRLATDPRAVKHDGARREPLSARVDTMRRCKPTRGRSVTETLNRDLATQTDFHEDENPEGRKGANADQT
jgi:hypothetical protein